jgi:hypothetical protein
MVIKVGPPGSRELKLYKLKNTEIVSQTTVTRCLLLSACKHEDGSYSRVPMHYSLIGHSVQLHNFKE